MTDRVTAMNGPQECLAWLRGLSQKSAKASYHLLRDVAIRGWMYATQAAETAKDLARKLAEAERRLSEVVDAKPKARATDPETSHKAVPKKLNLTRNRKAVLVVLRELGPMTDEQLHSAYSARARTGRAPAQSPSGLRTRRCELVRMGLVKSLGEVVRNGSSRCVWAARSRPAH